MPLKAFSTKTLLSMPMSLLLILFIKPCSSLYKYSKVFFYSYYPYTNMQIFLLISTQIAEILYYIKPIIPFYLHYFILNSIGGIYLKYIFPINSRYTIALFHITI